MGGNLIHRRHNDWTEFVLTIPAASSQLEPATAQTSTPTPHSPFREKPEITGLAQKAIAVT
jgi:hypothetical protein